MEPALVRAVAALFRRAESICNARKQAELQLAEVPTHKSALILPYYSNQFESE
jgi:hypothetical protein